MLENADMLFLATGNAQRGNDASHRGGSPGFIEVVNKNTLRIPDYPGNGLFNSLGNVAAIRKWACSSPISNTVANCNSPPAPKYFGTSPTRKAKPVAPTASWNSRLFAGSNGRFLHD
jgi:hypothetical protein